MQNFKPLLLATAAAALLPGLAAAQDATGTGACGQPAALNSAQLTFDSQPEDISGEFVQLTRNEPRYIELSITAPVALTFATQTGRVDATLILFNQNGQIIGADDDGGGDTDARLVRALAPGRYCLQVDQLADLAAPDAVVPVSVSAAPPPDACIKTAGAPVALKPDSDEIITSDQLAGKASIAMTLAAGTGVRIEARSPVFDTYLTLEDDLGQLVSEDDDSGGDTNSKLELPPVSSDATYCVNLTSLDEAGGLYALSIIPTTSTSTE